MNRLTRLCGVSTLLAVVSAGITSGCGSARRSEPLAGPLVLEDSHARRGELVFAAYCYQCHPGGAAGLGPALNNKPVPAALIKTQVRVGLGAMPSFDKSHISDEQLDDLATYLLILRHHGRQG